MLWREKSSWDQTMRQPLLHTSWIRSYLRLMYFLPAIPRWKYGHLCHSVYGQRVHFIWMCQNDCVCAQPAMKAKTVNPARSEGVGLPAYMQINCAEDARWTFQSDEWHMSSVIFKLETGWIFCSCADQLSHKGTRNLQWSWPCPVKHFPKRLQTSLIFQSMKWPSSKSHEAEDNNGYISPPPPGKQ